MTRVIFTIALAVLYVIKALLHFYGFLKRFPEYFLFLVRYSFNALKRFIVRVARLSIKLLGFLGIIILAIIKAILFPFKILNIRISFFILGFLICLFLVGINTGYEMYRSLPSPRDIGKINYAISTHLYDRKGRLLYEVYRDQNRTPVKIDDLPSHIMNATIAIEDKDFYNHIGVSPVSGMLRAAKEMIFKKNLQGGSTITQQLVKSSLLTPERTLERKVKEIVLAIQTERMYSKKQILELYLNQVPYGGSAYGIEEAAKVYFGKHAKDLTLAEAALLAGLPQAPSVYSPFTNPKLAIERRNEVLEQMYEQKYIDKNKRDAAIKSIPNFIPPQVAIKAPHFVFYVKKELENEFGASHIEDGGLRVYTSIDLDIQKMAETVLKEELAKIQYLNVSNGAILVTKPKTGEILAMVGSADYFASPSGAFNVTTAMRQPGSAIKPIMYSLALEKGFTAGTMLEDNPVVFTMQGSEPYRPVNYDGRFHGRIPLRYALANSYNVPAVRTLQTIGVGPLVAFGKRIGIESWQDPSNYGLSLTLGGGEVPMTELATAFGVFANEGTRVDLTGIIRMSDYRGNQIPFDTSMEKNIISNANAFIISDILSDNTARQWAFGPNSALEIPGYKVAVKTGTTDQKKDNWTIGYTPDILVAVWVGNNDNTPMNPFLTSGITGAAPIWNRVMRSVLESEVKEKRWFTKPSNIVERVCNYGRVEYFIRGTEQRAQCGAGITPTRPPIQFIPFREKKNKR